MANGKSAGLVWILDLAISDSVVAIELQAHMSYLFHSLMIIMYIHVHIFVGCQIESELLISMTHFSPLSTSRAPSLNTLSRYHFCEMCVELILVFPFSSAKLKTSVNKSPHSS